METKMRSRWWWWWWWWWGGGGGGGCELSAKREFLRDAGSSPQFVFSSTPEIPINCSLLYVSSLCRRATAKNAKKVKIAAMLNAAKLCNINAKFWVTFIILLPQNYLGR